MSSDIRAQQAREHHQQADQHLQESLQHRASRNRLVLQLRGEGWSYPRLAAAVGCSESLIAAIVKGRTGS